MDLDNHWLAEENNLPGGRCQGLCELTRECIENAKRFLIPFFSFRTSSEVAVASRRATCCC